MSAFDWASLGILFFSATMGGLVRRLSGFGGALIMSPLLMWVFPIPFFIPIVVTAELLGGVWLSRQWKVHYEDKPRLYRMWVLAALLLPIGIILGERISIDLLRVTTSLIVIFFSTYLLARPHFVLRLTSARDGISGAISGLLLGSCGIGGPPVALYLNSSPLKFDRSRALLSQFVSGVCFMAIVTASLLGGGIAWLPWLLLALPAYILGMVLGWRLLEWRNLSAEAIKKLCLFLLIANAVFNLSIIMFL